MCKLCAHCPGLSFADDGAFCGLGFTVLLTCQDDDYHYYSQDCKLISLVLCDQIYQPQLKRERQSVNKKKPS